MKIEIHQDSAYTTVRGRGIAPNIITTCHTLYGGERVHAIYHRLGAVGRSIAMILSTEPDSCGAVSMCKARSVE